MFADDDEHAMAKFILICFLLLVAGVSNSRAGSPLVGRLSGNKLVVRVNNRETQLELDLQAPVSTIRCGNRPSSLLRQFPLAINATDGANPLGQVTVPRVPFKCSTSSRASLLATSPKSLPAFLAAKRKIPLRFSYCLTGSAASAAPIFFGVDNVAFMPNKRSISSLLQYTPLQILDGGSKMGIHILGASFNSTTLPRISPLRAAVSVVEPYTKLQRPVYEAIRDAFNRLTGVPRASPPPGSPPFETCFLASALGSTRVGPGVPQLDLHLAGNATWSIFGANSLVILGDAACVALLPAAAGERSVIGAYTQRDNLIEFDAARHRFGYTSILYFAQTTCGNFNFTLSK